jgi:adenylosuccinate synthase
MKGSEMQANSTAVIGLQWGDEGKGKVVDFLSRSCDIVARFGGGSNAGHTIVINGEKFILRLLPSGIIRPNTTCYIGAGVACDPEVLESEISSLEKKGISVSRRLFVDHASHIVLPHHKDRDKSEESSRGSNAIDTTKRGIGPSYADRVSRIAIRITDLFEPETLRGKCETILKFNSACTENKSQLSPADVDHLVAYLEKFHSLFRNLTTDVTPLLMNAIENGRPVLFEGAQGSLLDVYYGTYPYTTSSHTTIGGLFTGLGLPPQYLGRVVGVVKSYMTRVGHGPFPTELKDNLGSMLREKGSEFGSVTGRPRRTGWLDLVALKRMTRLNGVTHLALTKLDVLDGLGEIHVCEAYDIDGEDRRDLAPNHLDFFKARPIYTKLKGWTGSVANKTRMADLPTGAREYIEFIETKTEVPVGLVSTGNGREDTVLIGL